MAVDEQHLSEASRRFMHIASRPTIDYKGLTPAVSGDFCRALNRAANVPSKENIQLCGNFIFKHFLREIRVCQALCDYIIELMLSFGVYDPNNRNIDTTVPGEQNEGLGKNSKGKLMQPPQPAFKRLHLLYVLSFALCHVKCHWTWEIVLGDQLNMPADEVLEEENLVLFIQPDVLPTVIMLAGCTGHPKAAKTHVKLAALLKLWARKQVIERDKFKPLLQLAIMADNENFTTLDSIKAAMDDDEQPREEKAGESDKTEKVIMPERHGLPNDPDAAWHHLPAANSLYLKRVHGYPMASRALPPGGFPVRGGGEPVNDEIQDKVKSIMKEFDRQFQPFTNADEVKDVDALGNIIWKDETRPTRNYWGWDVSKIEQTKEVQRRAKAAATGYANVQMYPRPDDPPPQQQRPEQRELSVEEAVARARSLAADRGRGMGWRGERGRGGRGGRGFGRGGRRY